MSASGIDTVNSGPLIIRTYLDNSPNNTYLLGQNEIPVSTNFVLITSTNGSLIPSNNIGISSIAVSSMRGGTIATSTVLLSSLYGNTISATSLYTSTGNFSTMYTSYISTSSLDTTSITTNTLTASSSILSSLNAVTITASSSIITSSLTSNNIKALSTITTSSLTTNGITATSTLSVSSVSTSYVTVPILAVSSITDLGGAPISIGGTSSNSKSVLVGSNVPVTLQYMTAMIDRTTQKVSLSFATNISTLYKTQYYVYNGSSWLQGYDVPPSPTPISLTTLKFPISTPYSLATVGSWCSLFIADMTTFSGTWTVNAVCLQTGVNGNDLYSLEIVQPNISLALTSVPNPPTNVITSIYPTGIGFNFTPPTVTGGYISNYEVFATSNGGTSYYTQTGFSSPIIVSGLTPGTAYTLSMKAKNSKGQSASAIGTPSTITYQLFPDPPTAVSGSLYPAGSATGINVSFTYPANVGIGIDLYYASALDTASTQNTVTASNATSPVYLSAGLVPGTTYQFSVYSKSAVGSGTASTSVGTLLYQVPPSAPAITSLALTPAGNPTGVAVGFSAPSTTGGGITDYITNLYSNGAGTGASASTIGTTSPITVNGLTAGTTYSFRVAGRNTGGTGILSAYSSIVFKTVPTAPTLTGVSLYPSGNPIGIQVLVSPPSNTGGGVDSYIAYAYYGSTLVASGTSNTNSVIVSSLTNGTFYTLSVVATNAAGTSGPSNTSTTQYKTLPDPPTNISGTLYPVGAATGINVSFLYPNSGGVIDQYVASAIDVASTASTVSAQSATSPIYLSAGLVAGTTYKFSVYSQNTGSNSIASTSASSLLFQTVPDPPTGITTLLTPVGNPSSVTVGFSPPVNTGGGITSYTAIAYSSVVAVASTIGTSSPLVIQTLTAGTTYNVVVKATNNAGTGMGSASSLITYQVLPSVTTNISGTLYPPGAATGINVSFLYPVILGGGVDLYYVMANDVMNTASTVLVTTTTSPAYIPASAGLITGTTYNFAVFAKNAGGSTPSTLSGSNLLFQLPPTAPLSLTTALTPIGNPNGITISFSPPANNGGGISYYTISAYSSTTLIETKQGTLLSYSFTSGLIVGNNYNFYVNATNTGGTSPSSITSTITYLTVPGQTTNLGASLYTIGTVTGINITFAYPTNLGGGVNVYYAMAFDVANNASTVLSTSATSPIFINTAMGLVPGTTYNIAVFSKNAAGSSVSTILETNLLYQTLPTAPTIATTTLDPPTNPTGVLVSFNPPSNTFGGITKYQTVAYNGMTPVTSSFGVFSPIKVSTLTAGISYNYTVAAINNAGIGISSAYTSLTYYTQPGAITSGVVQNVSLALDTPSNPSGVNVSFTPVTTTGGGSVSYIAKAYIEKGIITTNSNTSSPVYLTSLTAGTTYNFTVTPINTGVSGISSMYIPFTYAISPSAPLSITATVGYYIGSQTAQISWITPTNNGGVPISSYTVTSNPAVYTTTVSSNILTITTSAILTNGTPYTFTVLATNTSGAYNFNISNSVTPYGLAYQTSGLSLTIGPSSGQITLSWYPTDNNGKTITNYRIYQTGGSTNTYDVGNVVSYIVSGLSHTSYTFTVAATNDDINYGAASSPMSATLITSPSAPTNLVGTTNVNDPTIIVFSWSPPLDDGGSPIIAYYVKINALTNYSSQSSPYTFTGLSANTRYELYIYAVNAYGNGQFTYIVVTTPAPIVTQLPYSLSIYQNYAGAFRQYYLVYSAQPSVSITNYKVSINGGVSYIDTGTNGIYSFPVGSITSGTVITCYLKVTNSAGTTTGGPYVITIKTSQSFPA